MGFLKVNFPSFFILWISRSAVFEKWQFLSSKASISWNVGPTVHLFLTFNPIIHSVPTEHLYCLKAFPPSTSFFLKWTKPCCIAIPLRNSNKVILFLTLHCNWETRRIRGICWSPGAGRPALKTSSDDETPSPHQSLTCNIWRWWTRNGYKHSHCCA